MTVPINVSMDQVVGLILASQAQELADRARRALSQVCSVCVYVLILASQAQELTDRARRALSQVCSVSVCVDID